MIELYSSAGEQTSPAPGRSLVWLEPDLTFPVPWGALRQLLAALRQDRGDPAVDRALVAHRGPLSLVLDRLAPRLSLSERVARDRAAAQPLGYLTHSEMVQRPLRDAWGGALADLIGDRPIAIAIARPSRVDAESFAVLRQLARGDGGDAVHLHIAGDSAALPDDLAWRLPGELIRGQLVRLGEAAGRAVRIERQRSLLRLPSHAPPAIDPLDRDPERALWRRIEHCSAAELLSAARRAFACFGFPAVIVLGRELARRPATREEQAELHMLVGLAACAFEVQTGDDVELAELLDRELGAAIALTADPVQRSHMLYRQTIHCGRGNRQLDEALALGDAAIAAARDPGIPPATGDRLEAWARSGRAYVFARLQRLPEAIADGETALALLNSLHRRGDRHAEVSPGRLVMVDNLAQLATLAGDAEAAALWQGVLEQLEREVPHAAHRSPDRWTCLLRDTDDVIAASWQAERGLALARRAGDPIGEGRFAADLGDLRYRRGDAVGAREAYEVCLRIQSQLGGDSMRADLGIALAAARADQLHAARDHLERALASPACAAPGPRAEMLAALGVLAARLEDAGAADRLIDAAIERANEAGSIGVLVRVARAAGDAFAALGCAADADGAYRRALDLIADGDAAADLLAVLLRIGGDPAETDELTLRALALVPAALADGEAWWELPALCGRVIDLIGRRPLPLLVLEPARRLAEATALRIDGESVGRLLAELL